MYTSLASLLVAALFLQVVLSSPLQKRDRATKTNVFVNRQSFINSDYLSRLQTTLDSFKNEGDLTNARRVKTLQSVASTFTWYTAISSQSYFEPRLEEALKKQTSSGTPITLPFIIYNMPDRDCSSTASVGELTFANNGLNRYKGMIDTISSTINKYPSLSFAIVLEPDSIGNIVTNIGKGRCTAALSDNYVAAYAYAVSKLQQSNVALYIDVAHSNWLGWPQNLSPTAQFANKIVAASGSNTKIRGFSTNVSNYSPYNATTANTAYYSTNPNFSELRYAQALKPYLEALGLPAKFIVDTARSGRTEVLLPGAWCNINGAGMGFRPTTNTGSADIDALVWTKPPGDSDGSSTPGSAGYDTSCTGDVSLKPAPAPGVWFLEYSKMLVRNANPAITPAASL